MYINNVSSNINFGKTVRVNMTEKDAYTLAFLINFNKVPIEDRIMQQDAKEVFSDTYNGKAVVCSPDNGETFYILSGEESNKFQNLNRNIDNHKKSKIKELIESTKEKYILSPYDNVRNGLKGLRKFDNVK